METWKQIVGFEGYEVSDLGNVRSWRSKNGRGFAKVPSLLKPSNISGKPYLRVSLYKDGRPQIFRLHRLVLEAFVGPCPEGMEGCHNDGNPENNVLGNLRWGTPVENMQDQYEHCTRVFGERVTIAVLTSEQVEEIKRRLEDGKHGIGRQLAKEYGVRDGVISAIKNGKTWRHIDV